MSSQVHRRKIFMHADCWAVTQSDTVSKPFLVYDLRQPLLIWVTRNCAALFPVELCEIPHCPPTEERHPFSCRQQTQRWDVRANHDNVFRVVILQGQACQLAPFGWAPKWDWTTLGQQQSRMVLSKLKRLALFENSNSMGMVVKVLFLGWLRFWLLVNFLDHCPKKSMLSTQGDGSIDLRVDRSTKLF